MARKSSSTITQEELYPPDEQQYAREREEIDDARLLDLDVEQESPFLRGQKRVSVRRSPLNPKNASRLKWIAVAAILVCLLGFAAGSLYRYGEHSWRFRIESSDDIEITGTRNVTHAQVMEVLGGDIGRNIFFIPLSQRKAQLEQIPWVESASIMRFVPNHLKVEIHERTPVAFARIGPRISLMDAGGTIMELPSGANRRKYSFPVILDINPGEPHSTRAARMKIYNELIRELDSGGARYSQDLSEVDVSDPDDVKVAVADPSGEVLVHLGSSNFLDRYRIYIAHVREWRQQFDKLESVDLRYERQIIVNPDLRGVVKQPPLSASAMKAAMSAGVKPAALVTHETLAQKSAAPIATAKTAGITASKPSPRPAAKKARWKAAKHGKKAAHKKQAGADSRKPEAGTANPWPAGGNAKPAPTGASPAATTRAPEAGSRTPDAGSKTTGIRVPEAATKKPSPAIPKDQNHP
jgi:cell division protein FtsQ